LRFGAAAPDSVASVLFKKPPHVGGFFLASLQGNPDNLEFYSPFTNFPGSDIRALHVAGPLGQNNNTLPPNPMKNPCLLAGLAISTLVSQAANPRIDSWITDRSGIYARSYTNATAQAARSSATTWGNGLQSQLLPAYSGVQEITSSLNWVYIRTTGLGFHIMGPWSAGFPNLPANQHGYYRFPLNPATPAAGAAKTLTGNGTIGIFVDGVAMFDSRDAHYWNGTTDEVGGTGQWNREAYVNEGATFDPAFAHQENTGTYHYHANPVALRYLLGDHVTFDASTQRYSEMTTAVTRHSPILGWVSDGYPIYGPYGYAVATDPASGVRRMLSGYQLRNGEKKTDNLSVTGRKSLPAWASRLYSAGGTLTGPDVSNSHPLGRYMEDNAYLGDLGYTQGSDFDLDEHNGRFCVTPEFPNGTYAYFVSIASDGTPVFPYNIGRAYYGAVTAGQVTALTESVSTNFMGGPDAPLVAKASGVSGGTITLVWSAVEGGGYQVDTSSDLNHWTTAGAGVAPVGNVGATRLSLMGTNAFFRIQQTALAGYDSVTNSSSNTGGGGGPGGGGGNPSLDHISPTTGVRGSEVVVTFALGGMAPPAAIQPRSASLGSVAGRKLSRSGSNVTATFDLPATATPGAVTASVVFPGPPGMGDVTFSLVHGFTIQ
jgi:YHYH protein